MTARAQSTLRTFMVKHGVDLSPIQWGYLKIHWTREQSRLNNLPARSETHYRECRCQIGRQCNCEELRVRYIDLEVA